MEKIETNLQGWNGYVCDELGCVNPMEFYNASTNRGYCAEHQRANAIPHQQEQSTAPERSIFKADARKRFPVATGLVDYFPDALLEIARVSLVATEQHHPGEPLHWDRSKSTDEDDCLMRHFIDRGKLDTDGMRHSAKVAWRALALLQKEIEADQAKGEK